jgi:hypothetical protein
MELQSWQVLEVGSARCLGLVAEHRALEKGLVSAILDADHAASGGTSDLFEKRAAGAGAPA